MILFRVLNDYDMIVDPIKNGLASKKLIYPNFQTKCNKQTYKNALIDKLNVII